MKPPGSIKHVYVQGVLFEVRWDNTYTSHKLQEKGVPQESILSPTLLTIQINSVVKAMPVFPFLSSG